MQYFNSNIAIHAHTFLNIDKYILVNQNVVVQLLNSTCFVPPSFQFTYNIRINYASTVI